MFSVVKTSKIWFTLSGIFFAVSLAAIVVWGFRLGIDFTGGTLLEINLANKAPDISLVVNAIQKLTAEVPQVQTVGENGLIVRMKFIDENKHAEITAALKALPELKDYKEERFETIGPTISSELKSKAVWSILAVMLAIVIYIAWAFRQVAHPLPAWKFGVVAVISLLHDVIIPAGIFAALGHYLHYEVDSLFVTAILTVLGFSVHDTIVTFDRVREHLRRTPKADFEELVDRSVRETMRRSLFTSLTVLIVLLPVFFFGGATVRSFTLVLILGVIFGTYSSIFIACPLLVWWNRLAKRTH